MKVCSKCRQSKQEIEFPKSKQTKDGLFGWCKECRNTEQVKRQRRLGVRPLTRRGSFDELPLSKKCNCCFDEKPKNKFRAKIRIRKEVKYFELSSYCRDCEKVVALKQYNKRKNDEDFKEANRRRVKVYVEKNSDQIRFRRMLPEYARKHAEWNNVCYHRNKDFINAKQKIKRQTAKYKKMMREYRRRNKDKIYQQEIITKRRYHEKNRDEITDRYIFNLLRTQGMVKEWNDMTPELLELKKAEVVLFRLKNSLLKHKI